MNKENEIVIRAATAECWPDFEDLMGEKGGCGGCWCMVWRLTSKAFAAKKGAGNRLAMKALFQEGPAPGLLAYDGAYDGAQAVAWCSLAPRPAFPRLESSRVLKPVDTREVWSVSCFLIRESHRKRGLTLALLKAAEAFVRGQGGQVLEGYPIAPKKKPYPAVYAWTGFETAFLKAGFTEVLRRSETRPILRKELLD